MEIKMLETGMERVWSDSDSLSQAGYGETNHGITEQPVRAGLSASKLESGFERVWSDEDALHNAVAPKSMRKAA
ncbi:MAG: hypothetical protein HPY65_09040 [Syntrophaceae bacterium]|nr:hypothetical protein [Syntrophaceae bacterium]